jgi:hypothetical protein
VRSKEMLSPEKKLILKETLKVSGIDYELDMLAQSLRDDFPEGVPADEAIEIIKENYKDRDWSQQYVLKALAMVPVYGIEGEIIDRLEKQLSLPKSDEVYLDIFSLSKSLLYLGHPRGIEEFEKLRSYCKSFKENKEPISIDWFSSTLEEIEKWKRDRAAGKRWEIYQDEDE